MLCNNLAIIEANTSLDQRVKESVLILLFNVSDVGISRHITIAQHNIGHGGGGGAREKGD
jgi:hypothetical protein